MGRVNRAIQWFEKQPWDRRIQAIGLVVIALVVLVEIGLFGFSFYQSLQEGLAIYAEPWHQEINVTQATTAGIGFDVAVQNAPFCEARCGWQILDHRTGQLLATGEMTDTEGLQRQISVDITAPPTGRSSGLVQLRMTCENTRSLRCRKPADTATSATTTKVRTVFSQEKAEQAAALEQSLAARTEQITQVLSELRGIADVQDPRVQPLRNQALQTIGLIAQHAEEMRLLAQQENLTRLTELAQGAVASQTAARYREIVENERRVAERVQGLIMQEERVEALAELIDEDIADSAGQLTVQTQLFSTTQPETILATLDRLDAQIANATNQTGAVVDDIRETQQRLAGSQRQTCTLYGTACNITNETITDVVSARQALTIICQDIAARDRLVNEQRGSYVQSLPGNLTVADAEAAYNVSDVRNRTGWSEQERTILEAARRGVLSTSDPARILAVQPPSVNATCPPRDFDIALPKEAPQPTLPVSPRKNVTIPPIEIPGQQYCSKGDCTTDVTDVLPVLFVHGHSFAERSSPEYSLQAFSEFALRWQEEGRTYAGSVFPGQNAAPRAYAEVPGGVSLTTTYYYDSFAEEGNIRLIPRKSERIESYALRFSETVEEAKRVTGSDQVIVVAHSMGGLVVRKYLQLFGNDDVAALVMIGAPNHGIPLSTQRICPLVGADRECQDMQAGSAFLSKLSADEPDIPALVVAGIGCDQRDWDGVVEAQSAEVSWAALALIEGTCPNANNLLHNTMIDPEKHPDVYETVTGFVQDITG